MSLLVTTLGDQHFIKCALNGASPANVSLRLYKNSHTPGKSDTVGSYTESTATGYAAIALTGSSFDYTTTPGTAAYAQQSFVYTASETVYGYYITDSGNANVWAAELFSDGPYSIPSGGATVAITPSITFN